MSALKGMAVVGAALLLAEPCRCARAEQRSGGGEPVLKIRSLSVNGQPVTLSTNHSLRLSAGARNVTFGFGPLTNSPHAPLRIRYKLEGYEENWRETAGDLNVSLRFIDGSQEPVTECDFRAAGQTEGWTGTLETAGFLHRREVIVVPPGARGFWVAVSSAGPPNTVGLYAITNLVVSRVATEERACEALLRWDANAKGEFAGSEWVPADWTRNGLRSGMAKLAQFGPNQNFKALALLDNDPNAHAEWTSRKEAAPAVSAGEQLLFEWDEAYSLGLSGAGEVSYPELPPGIYRFRLNELSLVGLPGGAETSLAFQVPLSFWRTPSFIGLMILLTLFGAALGYRYVAWQQMRRQLARLESQRALEHERVRIARDIHDDLGARVTQISLVSGLALSEPSLPEKARSDFNAISGMARELVSALYETVWAVNPENDNLDALGNYLCQMVDSLCDKAQLPRRLHVAELPSDFQVSSHVRHHLVMAVKEAVHNAIKHARASELSMFVDWQDTTLTIRIRDNGCGFDPAERSDTHGLANMEQRLKQAGGVCSIRSEPGRGTTVEFRAQLQSGK